MLAAPADSGSERVDFTPRVPLVLGFQILLPDGRKLEECEVSAAISFLRDGAYVRRLEPRRITEANSGLDGVVNFATQVPLADFEAGAYQVHVQVIEHRSKKFATRRADLRVAAAK